MHFITAAYGLRVAGATGITSGFWGLGLRLSDPSMSQHARPHTLPFAGASLVRASTTSGPVQTPAFTYSSPKCTQKRNYMLIAADNVAI